MNNKQPVRPNSFNMVRPIINSPVKQQKPHSLSNQTKPSNIISSTKQFHKALIVTKIIRFVPKSYDFYISDKRRRGDLSKYSMLEKVKSIIQNYNPDSHELDQNNKKAIQDAKQQIMKMFTTGVQVSKNLIGDSDRFRNGAQVDQLRKNQLQKTVLLSFCPNFIITSLMFCALQLDINHLVFGDFGLGKSYNAILFNLLSKIICQYRYCQYQYYQSLYQGKCQKKYPWNQQIMDCPKIIYVSIDDYQNKQSLEQKILSQLNQLNEEQIKLIKQKIKDKRYILKDINIKQIYVKKFPKLKKPFQLKIVIDQINKVTSAARIIQNHKKQQTKRLRLLQYKKMREQLEKQQAQYQKQNASSQNDQQSQEQISILQIQEFGIENQSKGVQTQEIQILNQQIKIPYGLNKLLQSMKSLKHIFYQVILLSSVNVQEKHIKDLIRKDSSRFSKIDFNYYIKKDYKLIKLDFVQFIVFKLRGNLDFDKHLNENLYNKLEPIKKLKNYQSKFQQAKQIILNKILKLKQAKQSIFQVLFKMLYQKFSQKKLYFTAYFINQYIVKQIKQLLLMHPDLSCLQNLKKFTLQLVHGIQNTAIYQYKSMFFSFNNKIDNIQVKKNRQIFFQIFIHQFNHFTKQIAQKQYQEYKNSDEMFSFKIQGSQSPQKIQTFINKQVFSWKYQKPYIQISCKLPIYYLEQIFISDFKLIMERFLNLLDTQTYRLATKTGAQIGCMLQNALRLILINNANNSKFQNKQMDWEVTLKANTRQGGFIPLPQKQYMQQYNFMNQFKKIIKQIEQNYQTGVILYPTYFFESQQNGSSIDNSKSIDFIIIDRKAQLNRDQISYTINLFDVTKIETNQLFNNPKYQKNLTKFSKFLLSYVKFTDKDKNKFQIIVNVNGKKQSKLIHIRLNYIIIQPKRSIIEQFELKQQLESFKLYDLRINNFLNQVQVDLKQNGIIIKDSEILLNKMLSISIQNDITVQNNSCQKEVLWIKIKETVRKHNISINKKNKIKRKQIKSHQKQQKIKLETLKSKPIAKKRK